MGREERNRQNVISDARETVAEHRERIMGPVLENGTHAAECPKCGDVKSDLWAHQFCPGKVATLPPEVQQPCGEFGEHLHTTCTTCGWTFRQKCRDGVSDLAF